ncbi:MAG: BamA/TamA family outer membrane protein [candidate division KSB1 bacterium]|nr:BamA/TamA family outer membrane protein [candidate division KSB1 bacterium]MDZ7288161.1 BamA/TamA family outer membrane protein [candidate division KSB1 bacterium]MDZ7300326.1 BamA/TamA family outer membrane protein [candidate division KSB1 bacterium]MDZ7308668.1 BamA/TamA family outer membrane protein [candidate division KSB1 bacterium]MDZ7351326.1 BamA/TamA family outer membrane protein [candidate division KSB1 bacterium]
MRDSSTSIESWQRELHGVHDETAWLARLNNVLTGLAREGHPLASFTLDSVTVPGEATKRDSRLALLHLQLDPGPVVRLDSILIRGNNITKTNVLLRELPIRPGDKFNLAEVASIPERLMRLGFLQAVAPPQLRRTSAGRYLLDLTVTEGNSNFLNGVAGYTPGSGGERGFLTGLIDLKFGNLLGTGRLVNARWEKRSRATQELALRYREPWVAGWPLHLTGGFQQLIQDTLYVERRWEVTAEIPAGQKVTLIGQLVRATVSPDSLAAVQFGLPESRVTGAAVGLRYDSRDDLRNPRSGVYYATSLETGRKRVARNADRQTFSRKKLFIDFEWLLPVRGPQVLSLSLRGRDVTSGEPFLAITDQVRFGGATSLRGYREEQFRGSRVAWSNLEYRYLLSRQSRAFVFLDLGYYFREEPQAGTVPQARAKVEAVKRAWGLGARVDTPLGIVGLDYGLGEGDALLNGKVHVSLVNSF